MVSDAILHRQRLIMAAGVALSLVLPVVAWTMVPVGAVSTDHAQQKLTALVREHNLMIVGLDRQPPERRLPIWVAFHPMRLLESGPSSTLGLNNWTDHYRLRTAESIEFDCELHVRSEEVLWIRMDGEPTAAAAITPLRNDLRHALPWLPVSSPWK